MQKKTHDYDNVFKTMKSRHKRLFISVINDIFGKNYPMDAKVDVLPSEGYLTENEMADGSKEIEKRLFPYIPFYIARYEKEIFSGHNIDRLTEDLIYFRDEMLRLNKAGELSDIELIDLMGFAKTVITHITNGNKDEERLVKVMGGTIIETESERLIRLGMQQGQAKIIIEMGQEYGLDDTAILKRIQEKIGLSMEEALACMRQYGTQTV